MIYMFLSNNPSSGGYKFIKFVLLIVKNKLENQYLTKAVLNLKEVL